MRLTLLQQSDMGTVQGWLADTSLFDSVTSRKPDLTKPYYTFIIRLQDGTPVGWVDLFNVDVDNHNAEVGIAIPDHRGKGLSRRAALQMREFIFNHLGLHRVYARVPVLNTEALRLMEVLGFVQEGVERQSLHRDGKFVDVVMFGFVEESD